LTTAPNPLGASNPFEAAVLFQAGYHLRVRSDEGIVFEDGWKTVDKVLHPGRQEYYSSKPPLLSTLIAGLYWLLQMLFGWTLVDHPFAVVRTIVLLVNWVPLLIYLTLFARLLERYGTTDWGRLYVFAAACFGTLVTPFAITLNNHNIATYAVLFALYAGLQIWEQERQAFEPRPPVFTSAPHLYLAAGFFAGFAVCNELPAAAFAAALFSWLLWIAPVRTLTLFVPAAVVPVAALLLTNYLAVGQLRPAYSEFGGPWYQYEGSHWRPAPEGQVKSGIDWAHQKESALTYAFHVLVGHHGFFSLTPVYVLALVAMLSALRFRSGAAKTEGSTVRLLAIFTLSVSVVVIGFYLVGVDKRTHNYGGWSNGLRWLMWLAPLWLLCLLPAADRLSCCRRGRLLGYVLLGFSVLSVSYSDWNPWRHPWLYDFLESLGWPGY
jgi:hypothetical protein